MEQYKNYNLKNDLHLWIQNHRSDNEKCRFCDEAVETGERLLYECIKRNSKRLNRIILTPNNILCIFYCKEANGEKFSVFAQFEIQ